MAQYPEDPGPEQNQKRQSYILRTTGRDIDTRRVFNVPGVVAALLIVTVIAFFALGFMPRTAGQTLFLVASVTPRRFLAGIAANGGFLNMVSPLVSHIFVHANLTHLLMNSLWLMAFGAPVARRMNAENALKSFAAFSRASMFLSFYILCGVAGALAFIAVHADEITPMVGASGAVSGLMGALVRFGLSRNTLFGPERAAISPLSSQSVVVWSGFVVISNIVLGLFGGVVTGGGSIAWEAHLGGYFFGLLSYPFFERLARSFR